MKWFYMLLVILSLSILSLVFSSLYISASELGLSLDNLCLKSDCIVNFEQNFPGTLQLLRFGMSLIWIFVLVSGVSIALNNYLVSVRSSALSSHISHMAMFKNYVDDELMKFDTLGAKRINVFVWYSLAFPHSRDGDIKVSSSYLNTIKDIDNKIHETNNLISLPKGEYGYRKHQERMISVISQIGVDLKFMPRNDFYNVELELFMLIDSVNQTFSGDATRLTDTRRSYV